MILSFKQNYSYFEPTYFIQKIWIGFAIAARTSTYFRIACNHAQKVEYNRDYKKRFFHCWDGYGKLIREKIHTIREDKHNRWKVGMKIHFYVGSNTKNAFQFAPVVECKGVQNIEIIHTDWQTKIGVFECFSVSVDERILSFEEIDALAKNDGFKSIPDFLSWFNKDFKGRIIHWTDFRY